MKDMQIRSYESLEDALLFCIRASNREVKEVAAALWPSDPITTSYQRLIDALNPNKRQQLRFSEIIFVMHFCGRYDPLYYLEDECLHERSQRKIPQIEEEKVKQLFQKMLGESTRAYQEILKLTEKREQIEKIRDGHISYLELVKNKAG